MNKNYKFTGLIICFLILGLVVYSCKKKESPTSNTNDMVVSLVADKDSLKADAVTTSTITFTAKWEANDNPVVGLEVTFGVTLGSITQCDTTDSNGVASATLRSGVTAGISRITATYQGGTKKTIQVKFYSVSVGTIYIDSITAFPQNIPILGSTSTITALIKYTNNDSPAVDLPVFFTSTLGDISPICDTTDSAGRAITTLSSSDTAGIANIKAICGSLIDSTYVIFTSTISRDTIPASIVLLNADPYEIGVHGTGENETSMLTFQVRDKSGNPIGGTKQVNFTRVGPTGGNEYLNPTSVGTTRDMALAITYLNSGTKSGAVQIQAAVQGTSIVSTPVKITIVSGLPDSAHFSIFPVKLNSYALGIAGVSDVITAYVGDKYGNPVPNNTAVWFYTDCGLMQSGAGSTAEGITSNNLISCAPWPINTNGFFYAYGETIGSNNRIVKDSIRLLWSAETEQIIVSPTSFNISNAGSQDFIITVHDFNNNPLTEGTVISTSADAGELRGETNVNIPDTQSPAWTTFQVTLVDDQPDTLAARPCKLSISVTSNNGNREREIYGTIY